jgi:phosphoenolpyruvate synthase/pyruvate phosphate dikinase
VTADELQPLVVELGRGSHLDQRLLGGKAAGLERLVAASLPCPSAICLTTIALERYLDAPGLRSELGSLLGVEGQREPGVNDRLERLAFAAELPEPVASALADGVRLVCSRIAGPPLLAVRSSAVGEDGNELSFAGLHHTTLGVSPEGVELAVRKCWASLWSSNAMGYRAEPLLPSESSSMAVVIQALVAAEASAVAFTANPLTGASDELLIHATYGLGPALVDNLIAPDTAVFAKPGLRLKRLDAGEKHIRLDARRVGGIAMTSLEPTGLAVCEDVLRELARLSLEVERQLGQPADVEAALSSGRWLLTQARPITAPALAEAR